MYVIPMGDLTSKQHFSVFMLVSATQTHSCEHTRFFVLEIMAGHKSDKSASLIFTR